MFRSNSRQLFPLQIHTGTSAPAPSVVATFSSPVAPDLTAPGKTEKPGQPDDGHPHSEVLPTDSPVPVKSTAKAQAATSVPSGVPTNGSVPTAQSSTAAAPSTAATTPGEDLQVSSKCHLLRLFQAKAVWKNRRLLGYLGENIEPHVLECVLLDPSNS